MSLIIDDVVSAERSDREDSKVACRFAFERANRAAARGRQQESKRTTILSHFLKPGRV